MSRAIIPNLLPAAAIAGILLMSGATAVAEPGDDTEELAKQAQNPIAKMISVPFQNNYRLQGRPARADPKGPQHSAGSPLLAEQDWNLITRTIVPIVHQPSSERETRTARRHQPDAVLPDLVGQGLSEASAQH